MPVNYLQEIVAFNEWKEVNQLPATAIALWHELMAINNKCGWQQEFTVPNGLLQIKAGLSRKQFDAARLLLIQKGRITYKKSNNVNQAGKYSMIPFVQKGQQNGQREGQQRVQPEGQQEEHREGNERGTLFKQNKTKQNKEKKDNRQQKYDDDSPYMKMAVYLKEKILSWKPDAKVPENLNNWADEFRKLHELDGRSKQDIKDVIDWVTSNTFWQPNVLSAKKLREKFDTLQGQMKNEQNKKVTQFPKRPNQPPEKSLPKAVQEGHRYKPLEEMTPEERAEHEEKVKQIQEKIKRMKEIQEAKKREVAP